VSAQLPQEILADEDWEQVEASLARRISGRIRELRVHIRADGLVIQGFARTWYAKQLAQHAASEMTGLRIIANEIVVASSG
jgi:hypothetical protein